MIVKNWEYDEDSLEMFQYYRISSNAIYPFRYNGKTRLLRFAPVSEKNKESLEAELDFISYLHANDYPVLEAVESKSGQQLIEIETPWGTYYASVFKRVPGTQIGNTDCNDSIIYRYGQALGRLHYLSSQYAPVQARRWSYRDCLDWMEEQLLSHPEHGAALAETRLLRDYFAGIPATKANFGLVHYDFEYDNVFYDVNSAECYAIDFDDSMYHWYAMDIEQALDSLRECTAPEDFEGKRKSFMTGYAAEYALPESTVSLLPACRRFASLYSYVRLLRSTEERWDHEPSWLSNLRQRLEQAMTEDAAGFMKEL